MSLGGWILDGHNRYAICEKHGIAFETAEKSSLKTLDDVKVWMIQNQMGRRNLTDFQRVALALKLKPIIEKRAKENSASNLKQNESTECLKSDTRINRTDEQIAKQAGVGKDTVRNVEKIIEKAAPEVIEKVRRGEMSISAAAKTVAPPKPPKAVKAKPIEVVPEGMEDYDLAADIPTEAAMLADERAENAILAAQVEAFQQSDKDAELEKQIRIRFGIEQRLQQEMSKSAAMDKELRYFGGVMAELRKLLRVDDNRSVVGMVRAMMERAA